MHLILTGATGLVGTAVLEAMLSAPEITRISVLSRRPVAMVDAFNDKTNNNKENKNVQVLIHKDFGTYEPALLEKLRGAEGCVWAIGIPYRMSLTDDARNKAEYTKITHTWPVASARAFAALAPRFNFVYVSGEGATQAPNFTSPFFGRIKGQAETSLLELLGYRGEGLAGGNPPVEGRAGNVRLGLQPFCVRPGFVDAAGHDDIKPYIPQPSLVYALSETLLGPMIRRVVPSMHSPTRELGRILVHIAEGKIDHGSIISAKDISSLASNIYRTQLECQKLERKS